MARKCKRCGVDGEEEALVREELNECPRCGESLAVAQVRDLAEAAAKSSGETSRLSRKGPRPGIEGKKPSSAGRKEQDTTEDMPPRGHEPACDPPEGE